MPERDAQKKSSAAEVLTALRDEVGLMAARLDEVADFTRRAKSALLKQVEEHRLDAVDAMLHSMFQLHDVVYRQVRDGNQDEFLPELLKVIEGELEGNSVFVISPRPGDAHDSARMKVLQASPADDGNAGDIFQHSEGS
ncbi:MAG: hypothetical protein ACYTGZ_19320 [Planctomycetota bacterium]|jgi:uncharacterized protein YaaQ